MILQEKFEFCHENGSQNKKKTIDAIDIQQGK